MPIAPVYVAGAPCDGFRYETDLAEPVRHWLGLWTDLVVEELRVQKIADLVGAHEATPGAAERRISEARPVLVPVQLALLEYCTTDRSDDQLRRWAPHGWRSLRDRAILPLVDSGCLSYDGRAARTLVSVRDPFASLVAVELKLRDWRSALCQAVSYGSFAEYSFVALPSRAIRDEAVTQARRNGIGVLSVSDRVETVVAAQCRDVLQPLRRRLASELVLEEHTKSGSPRRAGAPIVSRARSATP